MVYAVYFSATKTTEKIVKRVANNISHEFKTIDITKLNNREDINFKKDDIVIFGIPVYAGRVPNLLLKKLKYITGNNAKLVTIVVYGNRNFDDALVELNDLLNDFRLIASAAFIGEHSFSKELAKNRPDKEDIKIINKFSDIILTKLKNNEYNIFEVKGTRPYRNYYRPIGVDGNYYDFRLIKPKTNRNCNNCKLCAIVCPVDGIDREDASIVYKCIKCNSCVKLCPSGAKYFDDPNYIKHKKELEEIYKDRKEPELFY